MTNCLKRTGLAVAVTALLFLTACGGNDKEVSIKTVSSATQDAKTGESKTFTIVATNTGFTATYDPANGHGCVANSTSVICTPTLAGSYTITLTATADTTKKTTLKLNVTVPVPEEISGMVYLKAGAFTMGCTSEQGDDCFPAESPAHEVTLTNDFYIGAREVTQADWKAVMGAENNPSHFKGDTLPVTNVNWAEVQEFISKLKTNTGKNYRLPTEAEWEYAARGGEKHSAFKYSGGNDANDVAWYGENSEAMTQPVGTKAANALGLFDMSGNVHEWTADWYGDYGSAAQTNPTGPATGTRRVIRGGGGTDVALGLRVSFRGNRAPEGRGNGLGFRLACSPQ